MNTKVITIIVVAVTLGGLVVYDLVVNFNKVTGDTISEVLAHAFREAPILSVTVGVVAGHLASEWEGVEGLTKWISLRPLIPLLYGVLGGFLFWNQSR
jgi:hypothetical protein